MQVLEKYFDTAFDSPDGIKKLRELILTLAMQGKLVPQEPNDQPASELLKEIKKEKEKLVKEGKLKQIKPISKIKENEIPYDLPKSWKLARLSEFAEYNGRKNISPEFIDDNVWLLDLEDIEKTTSNLIYRAKYSERQSKSTKSTFEKNDVLYGKLRPYLDKVIVADQNGVCTTEIVPIVPYKKVDSYFLRYLLKRPTFLKFVDSLMYGVKMPRLGTQDAINSIHPLPPYEEQKRIVEKINQLMALCDELEKLKQQKETQKLRVHKSAINQLLDSKDNINSQKGWHFISKHFNDIYTVKENVSELRSAILQLAMQGKLVPQDQNDQPASELLKEIEKEKQELIKDGKIKKSKSLEAIQQNEMLFMLPNNWTFVRLIEIGTWALGSGLPLVIQGEKGLEILLCKVSDMNLEGNEKYIITSNHTVSQKVADESKLNICEPNTIIFPKIGGAIATNKRRIIIKPTVIDNNCLGIKPFSLIDLEWAYQLLQFFDFSKYQSGTSVPAISQGVIGSIVIGLPPKNEQKRIVEKINQLMVLCDDLEKQIENSSSKQTQLLNAIMSNLGK